MIFTALALIAVFYLGPWGLLLLPVGVGIDLLLWPDDYPTESEPMMHRGEG